MLIFYCAAPEEESGSSPTGILIITGVVVAIVIVAVLVIITLIFLYRWYRYVLIIAITA